MSKTLLVILGLACAVITTAGVMWYNPIVGIHEQLNDESIFVHYRPTRVYDYLYAPKSISEIIKLLNDKDPTIRRDAVIESLVIDSKEAIPGIVTLLQDDVSSVRNIAVWALGKLGAKEAIPEIKKLLKDEDVRYMAEDILKQLGVPEEEIKKSLNLYDYFGLKQINKVRVTHYPKGFLKPDEAVSKETLDKDFIQTLRNLLKQLPTAGNAFKKFPKEIEFWEIELYALDKKTRTLDFYGSSLQSPYDHSFGLGGAELLAHIKVLFR